jgi:hypothetical protein
MTTLSTAAAAKLAGVDPRSFARWARARRIQPLHRVRIGRSMVTVWAETDVISAGCLTN